MKILDRYLLKNFILFLSIVLFLFIFIFLIVDISDNLSGYIQSGKTLKEIFFLYLFYIPSLLTLLFPLGILVSIFITVGIMIKNNELLAIKASGISVYRYLLPLFFLVIILSFIQFFLKENVETYSTKRYKEIKESKEFDQINREDFIFVQDEKTILKGEYFSVKNKLIRNPEIFKIDDQKNLKVYIQAKRGVFRDDKWIFESCQIYDLEKNRFEIFESREMFDILNVKPDEMIFDRENVEIYKISELLKIRKRILKSKGDPSKQETEISYRFYFLFINIIISIISASFVVNTKNTGIIFGLSISVLLSFLYWGVLQGFRSAASNSEGNPFLIFLYPNFLFLFVSIFLLYKSRK
ncbi:MAG: LptF/LptG family permease [candidate division WOR-3 bacterium]